MKKIILIFKFIANAIEASLTKREGIVWEFVEDIDNTYGRFKNLSNGKICVLFKDGCEFRKERLYEFEPKRILLGFGYLGTPNIYDQTWKAVSYP